MLFSFFSCKKKDNASGSVVGGSPSISGGTTVASSNATSWRCIFESGTTSSIINGILRPPDWYVSDAYFSSSPVFYPDPTYAVQVDTVKANGRKLAYLNFDSMYEDTSWATSGMQIPVTFPITWHVAGKNGIPGFTYSETAPLPTYTGYSSIPDTINHAANFTLQLTGASGFSYVSMALEDTSQHGTSATGGNNAASLVINAADMAQFVPCRQGQFSIDFQKWTVLNINGTDMLFTGVKTITKTVVIK
jgi:hypothetical protein